MDALLAINAGSRTADAIIPAKEPQRDEQPFKKVLHKQRSECQHEKKTAEKHTDPTKRSEPKHVMKDRQRTEAQQSSVAESQVEDPVVTIEGEIEAKDAALDVVVALPVPGRALDVNPDEVVLPQSEVVIDENSASTTAEIQLSELGGSLEVSSTDEASPKNEDGSLEPAVDSLPQQSVEAIVVPQVVEPVVIAAGESQHQVVVEAQSQVAVETQGQVAVKTVEQQTVRATVAALENDDAIVPAAKQNNVVLTDVEGADLVDENEKVDPRFASLLKPRAEKLEAKPLKDVASLHGVKSEDRQQSETGTVPTLEMTAVKKDAEPVQLAGLAAKQVLEQQAQPGHHLQGQSQAQVQGFDTAKVMQQTPVVQLSNGYQMPESQIFDQVVTQISGSVNGESGRMVLRLQPAELGSLKLDLKIEGDRVQAHLHAQTHQVQDVLERNLPQLRSALAEQGLKIDQFLVNVDQHQSNGQFESMTQQHNGGSDQQQGWQPENSEVEEQMIPLAHLMQNGGGGISLHV